MRRCGEEELEAEEGVSSSPGCLGEQQHLQCAAELCHYRFSQSWPLINYVALVLFSL